MKRPLALRGDAIVTLRSNFAICLLLVAVQSAGLKPAAHVLDLVAAPAKDSGVAAADALEVPGGFLALNEKTGDGSLRVHLNSLEPLELGGGDPVVYEMTIENVGRTSIRLPWSPTNEGLRRTMPGAMVAVLSLAAAGTPDSPGDFPVLSQVLYGVQQVGESVITLGPGESAQVRAPGHWTLQSQIRDRVARDRRLRLVGTLRLYRPTGPLQVRSAEEVSVLIRN